MWGSFQNDKPKFKRFLEKSKSSEISFSDFFFVGDKDGEKFGVLAMEFTRSWGMGKAAEGGIASGSHFVVMDLRSFFIGANMINFLNSITV